MKIIHQKIPVTVKRSGKETILDIHDDEMKIEREEDTEEGSSAILTIAKDLGDYNEKSMRLAKGSLLNKETERKTFIIRKILA